MKAIWNGQVIASSGQTIELEGNHYFPAESVDSQFLSASDTTTTCPWKGKAHYYSVVVNGNTNPDAAWYYPSTRDAAREIEGYVAFWRGIEVTT